MNIELKREQYMSKYALKKEMETDLDYWFPLTCACDVKRAIRFCRLVPTERWSQFITALNKAIRTYEVVPYLSADSILKSVVPCEVLPVNQHDDDFKDALSEIEDGIVSFFVNQKHTKDIKKYNENDTCIDLMHQISHLSKRNSNAYAWGNILGQWEQYAVEASVEQLDILDATIFIFQRIQQMLELFTQRILTMDEKRRREGYRAIKSDLISQIVNMYAAPDVLNPFEHGSVITLISQATPSNYAAEIIAYLRCLQARLQSKSDQLELYDLIETEILKLVDCKTDVPLNESINYLIPAFPITATTEYLEKQKNESKNQIDIILKSNAFSSIVSESSQTSLLLEDWASHLEGRVYYDNISRYGKPTLEKQFLLEHLEPVTSLRTIRTVEGKYIRIAQVKEGVCVVLDTTLSESVRLMELSDGMHDNQSLIENLTAHPIEFQPGLKARVHTLTCKHQASETQSLTEGIVFDKTGGFKISFKPKVGYMDQYAKNHKLLVANHQNRNYEGMKDNLGFLFYLINEIEHKVIYSKKSLRSEVVADAEKARMFAINDFKSYLKLLQDVEPQFNFTRYYEDSDYGKHVFGFKKEEIIGLKRLFQMIML